MSEIVNNDNLVKMFKDLVKSYLFTLQGDDANNIAIERAIKHFDKLIKNNEIIMDDASLQGIFNVCIDYFENTNDSAVVDNNNNFLSLLLDKYYEMLTSDTSYDNETSSSDSVKAYLKLIGKIEVLTREQEQQVFYDLNKALESADEDKVDELKKYIIYHNLKLVVPVAKRYMNRGVEFLDLIQEGNIGLIKGVDKFDVNKGYKFSTYATWWIKQAVTRALAEQSRTIRIPKPVQDNIRKINQQKNILTNELKREPTSKELADTLGINESKLRELLKYDQEILSIDEPLNNEDKDSVFVDFITGENEVSVEDQIEDMDRDARVHIMLEQLSKSGRSNKGSRSSYIIKRRFGIDGEGPKTLEDVGKELNITRERVRQIEAKSIRELRVNNRNIERDDNLPPVYDEEAISKKIKEFTKYSFYNDTHIELVDYNRPSGLATLRCNVCGKQWTEPFKTIGKNSICMKCALDYKKRKENGEEDLLPNGDSIIKKINLISSYIGYTPEEVSNAIYTLTTDEIMFLVNYFNVPKTDEQQKQYNDLIDKVKLIIKKATISTRAKNRRKYKPE